MVNFKHLPLTAMHLMGVNAALSRYHRGKIKTLIYHNVLPRTETFPGSLAPLEFERHIVLIKEKYNPVYLDESGAIVGFAGDKINVLITFDDGFTNNFEYVFPLLLKHGLKATFFLIVDCVETGSNSDHSATLFTLPRPNGRRVPNGIAAADSGNDVGRHDLWLAHVCAYGSHPNRLGRRRIDCARVSGTAQRTARHGRQNVCFSLGTLPAGPARGAHAFFQSDLHD